MENDETPYLTKEHPQYKRFDEHLKEIGLSSSTSDYLSKFPSLALVTEDNVNYVWKEAGVKEVPANIGMEIFTSIMCGIDSEELEKIWNDKQKTYLSINFDILLKSQKISPLYLKTLGLEDTYFVNNFKHKCESDSSAEEEKSNTTITKKQKNDHTTMDVE